MFRPGEAGMPYGCEVGMGGEDMMVVLFGGFSRDIDWIPGAGWLVTAASRLPFALPSSFFLLKPQNLRFPVLESISGLSNGSDSGTRSAASGADLALLSENPSPSSGIGEGRRVSFVTFGCSCHGCM